MGRVRIGISGWRYPNWRGSFYPQGLRQADELAFAASRFDAIELNGSFYSLQRPALYERWRQETPDHVRFAVKGGRFITHMKKLRDVDTPLANFFASGLLCLGEKLGPVLWQLPAQVTFDPERLEAFFELLPRDTGQAARLARKHDDRLPAPAATKALVDQPIQHALEVRHESFRCDEYVALLRRHGIANVVADTAGRWPLFEDVTAPFCYVRLHGDTKLYESGYERRTLLRWANRIGAWAEGGEPAGARRASSVPARPRARSGRDVWVFFDNDAKVHAPFDAVALAKRLGVGPAFDDEVGPRGPTPRGPSIVSAIVPGAPDRRWSWGKRA
jgi:uncharacterized protein YecE (DUF72 family)